MTKTAKTWQLAIDEDSLDVDCGQTALLAPVKVLIVVIQGMIWG